MPNWLKNLFLLLLVGAVISVGGLALYPGRCGEPIAYTVGSLDPRFGLSQPELVLAMQRAEAVWEETAGRDLLAYTPSGGLKINLIYDQRQEKLVNERRLREELEAIGLSYEGLSSEFDRLEAEFNRQAEQYNNDVKYWNERGGAPPIEYARLQRQRQELEQTQRELNRLVDQINVIAERHNLQVDVYNLTYGKPQRFDQGEYVSRAGQSAINIYTFADIPQLELVAAHEFGHALGLDHVQNPQAVMYELMDQQDTVNLKATAEDIGALYAYCGFEE